MVDMDACPKCSAALETESVTIFTQQVLRTQCTDCDYVKLEPLA